MAEFRVWAPKRRQVELLLNGSYYEMDAAEDGWWAIDVTAAKPGQDYKLRVDREIVCPDPRSRWQPNGVCGPSRLVDFQSFTWRDHGFQARPFFRRRSFMSCM
jgi:maltooligosyltrehalose trehalohydrolase